MTSSLSLMKRQQMRDTWAAKNFSLPGATLGGMEDHYVTNIGLTHCLPGFEAVPIGGNPYGMGICKRIYREEDIRKDEIKRLAATSRWWNGDSKYQADLYDPSQLKQRTITDLYPYHSRTAGADDFPGFNNEQYYILNDYLPRQIRYNGTGIQPVNTPFSSFPRGTDKYFEYGFSYTDIPPPKYDVTRLEQPYPVWRQEMLRLGLKTPEEMRKIDEEWNYSINYV